MRKLWLCFCFILAILIGKAQTTDLPLGHLAYYWAERQDVLSEQKFSTTVKPYSRKAAFEYLKPDLGSYLSLVTQPYSKDSANAKKPILNTFYKLKQDMYFYNDKTLDLHVNPVIHFSVGADNTNDSRTFINTRGIELRGSIDKKVAFYTYLTENQARYPTYVKNVTDTTIAVPFEGFWKQYSGNGVDFLRAFGYVDFALSNSISAQMGYGKHFVGDGQRSLILSDFSNNYPYLRINTKTKVFDYTNVFAQLIAGVDGGNFGVLGTGSFAQKYMAFHHLNIKLKPNLHIGFFESVMFGDSSGGFKLEYLNPVVFYRTVEQQNGSTDNAFVGMDIKWNPLQRFSFYGQLVIDELIVSNVFNNSQWWGNKQGYQLGMKYFDALGVKNLMFQGEFNKARPFMYAHENGFTNYSHYNLPLAHPLGANFTEYLGRVFYTIGDKWQIESSVILANYGNDLGDENYGRDILKDYTVRAENNREFGVAHLQGNQVELSMFFLRASYMFKHNLFFDLEATLRNEKDENGNLDMQSSIFGFSVRLNSPARTYLF